MSLYGPTFHVTPVDLCIIFQCNLSCIMSCRNKIVSNCFNCFKLFQLFQIVLWALEVLWCLYWHSFGQTGHSTLWRMVVGVNWLPLCQECRRAVFRTRYCSSCTLQSFFPFWKIRWSVMLMTALMAVVPSLDVRVTLAGTLIRDLFRVCEWCDLWRWNLTQDQDYDSLQVTHNASPVTPINY